ncbi:hypothetical protein [Actinoplanes sp. NPDC049681]|uniref:hypothetical protein n=1 Tax=Actinoplanes sp. NPDC049681 TaxID=3363905 RepID=UPI0037B6E1C0
MSADPPNPPRAPRRTLLRRVGAAAGPIVVSALFLWAVLHAAFAEPTPAADSPCHGRPETVRAIRKEAVFTRSPAGSRLDEPVESYSCGSSPADGPVSFVSNASVTRRLTTSMSEKDVRAYYADLAARSGWRPAGFSTGVYSAIKPAGGCPWWFAVTTAKGGYGIGIYYQPAGVAADDCEWASGRPAIVPLSR